MSNTSPRGWILLLCRGPRDGEQASSSAGRQGCGAAVHTAALQEDGAWVGDDDGRCSHLFTPSDVDARELDWGSIQPPGESDCGCVWNAVCCGGCGSVVGTVAGNLPCPVHDFRYSYKFLADRVYVVPTTGHSTDSVLVRTTHAPSRLTSVRDFNTMGDQVRPVIEPFIFASHSRNDTTVYPTGEFEQPPRYFQNADQVRAALIAILETYMGELDAEAEIVLPTEQIVSLDPAAKRQEEIDEKAEAQIQADCLAQMAERIWRERQLYENGTPPQVRNPGVADVDVTSEGRTRITVNSMVLQMAEAGRAMAFSQVRLRGPAMELE
ncbi:hypothetical protein DFH07DRAFT_962294 [Mycena maculata]|uniref:Uncharacterized protein n=1 Tax=Mycena maculata TaxID=230809 RepID=A0AAD7N750_9AGAR|nr:hypothetical protein DFH07DRAFT_962294 [Mycena maculata]